MKLKFTLSGYEELLSAIGNSGFEFSAFSQNIKNSSVLLRHDVDADLQAAVEMAKVEARLGISSTFYLMLRSPTYNLLNAEFARIAAVLLDLGHSIGLHYDQNFDELRGLPRSATIESIHQQASWIQQLLSCEVKSMSFHQPSETIMGHHPKVDPLIGAYELLKNPNHIYVSDSNRRDSFSTTLEEVLANKASYETFLQILVHPMWWVYEDNELSAVWNRVFESNLAVTQRHLLRTGEQGFGAAGSIETPH